MRPPAAPRLRRSSAADGSLWCPRCVAFHGRTPERKHIGHSFVNEPGHGPRRGCPPCGRTRTWRDPQLLPIPQVETPIDIPRYVVTPLLKVVQVQALAVNVVTKFALLTASKSRKAGRKAGAA